jgi:alkanesulfonate monooxygenase SsuD/methylene tetrahydromethanopterin reductase-like flavin-dependent oxidoreductase (luciferase family)
VAQLVTAPHPPVLVGVGGPRGLSVAAEVGDEWMPIVDDLPTFESERSELHRLCDMRGRADLEVTGFLFEADEQLLEGCARRGVSRCAVLAPTNDRRSLESFLERYSALSSSIA